LGCGGDTGGDTGGACPSPHCWWKSAQQFPCFSQESLH
jgi:hypothetical protein